MRLKQQTHHHQAKHPELLLLMNGSPTHENYACDSGQQKSKLMFSGMEVRAEVPAWCKGRCITQGSTWDSHIHLQMPKDITRGGRSTLIQPTGLAPSPISNAIREHPELTLHCLPALQATHITHRSKLTSRVGGLRGIAEQGSSC